MNLNDFTFIKGFPSNSASQTDIWLVRKDNQKYIMKLFISESNDKIGKELIDKSSTLLIHEKNIYQQLQGLRNVLQLESYFSNLEYYDLLEFLTRGETELPKRVLQNNLNTNIHCMITNNKNRPSVSNDIFENINYKEMNIHQRMYTFYKNFIESTLLVNKNVKLDFKTNFRYSIIVTKYTPLSLEKYVENSLRNSNYTSRKKFINEFFGYILIIMLTCIHDLGGKGINQNDLHPGNILLSDETESQNYLSSSYIKKYTSNSGYFYMAVDLPYRPIIYDFDRSTQDYKENILPTKEFEPHGQCIHYNPYRDMTKILCYLLYILKYIINESKESNEIKKLTVIRNNILNLSFNKNYDQYDEFINIMDNTRCFFKYQDKDGVYSSLLCRDDVLENIIQNNYKNTMEYLLKESKHMFIIDVDKDIQFPMYIKFLESFTNKIITKLPIDEEDVKKYINNNSDYNDWKKTFYDVIIKKIARAHQ